MMGNEMKGLYIGTMNLISSSLAEDGMVQLKRLRHGFLKIKIESSMTGILKNEGLQYAEVGRDLYALGDSASHMAHVTGQNINRSICNGILDSKEEKAEIILKLLIETLIGKANGENSLCCYSVPAETSEGEHRVVYHSEVMNEMLKSLGYRPLAVNEGLALVFSSLAARRFTGMGISCGGGLLNVCLAHQAHMIESFSVDRGGDWIDENASKVLGMPLRAVTMAKEKGTALDLEKPTTRIEKAIAVYYKEMIRYAIEIMRKRIEGSRKCSIFQDPIDIVFSGAVALPKGFVSIFSQEISKVGFPLKVGQISLAHDLEYAIARGCLIKAMSEVL
ncbi:MAG: hypothetical protein HQL21_05685 [Candidatus Omnitrophica bacterium]|nr:hypothetical protein [Candidatus Omnitrophota bacterium]